MQTPYLSLTDYSSKYRVSVSTLRRRIKNETIDYRVEHGKYIVPDQPFESFGFEKSIKIPNTSNAMTGSGAKSRMNSFDSSNLVTIGTTDLEESKRVIAEKTEALHKQENDFATTKLLLNEIKKAYMAVLQEKEVHIIELKRELSDVNTLVRALERENAKMRGIFEEYRSHYENELQNKEDQR